MKIRGEGMLAVGKKTQNQTAPEDGADWDWENNALYPACPATIVMLGG